MPQRKPITTLDVRTRADWRAWLERNHGAVAEIWLVFHKRHSATPCVAHEAAIEEALCFGWIDSLVRRLDENRYAIKFTPRTSNSRWSALNVRRYARVEASGLLTDAGRARPPTDRLAVAPPRRKWPLPKYIEKALKANGRAWRHFERLAASYRRAYIGWIDSAKREETKQRRLREAVQRLARGEKLGLK